MALVLLDLTEAKQSARTQSIPVRRTMSPATMEAVLGGGGAGGFHAAKMGRLTSDWTTIRRSADQDLQFDLPRMRARARERAINGSLGAKFLQMLRTNVVGKHGIRLNFKVEKLRKSGDDIYDDATNEALSKAWKKWCRRKHCTVHGKYSFRDVCNMAADSIGRDGDFIVRKVYSSKKDNPFGFSLQLIDADQLNDMKNQIGSPSGPQIRMGVEVDQYQKPVAYHIYDGNPFESGMGSANCQRVPAEQVYHWFIPRRIGQTRGYPLLAPVLWDMNMLEKYFGAELTAARAGAAIFASIEQDRSDGEYEGDGENPDGSTRLEIDNGSIAVLGPGQKLNNQTPQHPTAAFSPFVERSLRLISSGLGVAYHELGNDLAGVNFSSGRLGVLEARDYYMELQEMLIEGFVQPVYEDWVKAALLSGAIDLPFTPDRFTDDDVVQFLPRRWSWVDPLKDVQASVDEIQNGFTTHEEKMHSMGRDWRAVYRQLKVEKDYANELGITVGTDIRGDALSEMNDGAPEEDGTPGNDNKTAEETPAKAKPKPKTPPKK